jgi:hypothetical protein
MISITVYSSTGMIAKKRIIGTMIEDSVILKIMGI